MYELLNKWFNISEMQFRLSSCGGTVCTQTSEEIRSHVSHQCNLSLRKELLERSSMVRVGSIIWISVLCLSGTGLNDVEFISLFACFAFISV